MKSGSRRKSLYNMASVSVDNLSSYEAPSRMSPSGSVSRHDLQRNPSVSVLSQVSVNKDTYNMGDYGASHASLIEAKKK